MNEPLVSIIVPVYNTEKYLDRCIKSIVNQSYKNLEIILVDDGSPDNCPQMCDEWAEKDNRIKVIHKLNDGLANARNTGIEACTGDYVMFTDSDDYIELDMVEFLLNLSVKYNADVSRCGFYYNYDNGNQKTDGNDYTVKLLEKDDRIIELVTTGFCGTVWNKLYKREVVKSNFFSKQDGCSEDILYNFRVYKEDYKTVFSDVPKYHYVIRDNSITNNTFGYGAFDIIRAKQIVVDYAEENENILPYAIKGYVMSAFIVLSGCIQNDAFYEDRQRLIKRILSYKKYIFKSKLYSNTDKLKTLVLFISPRLYEILLKGVK